VRKQVVTDGATGETVYYVYDAGGQRVRKVIERPGGAIREERLYLGSYEVYRERSGGNVTLERETLHVMDDQRRIAMVETKTIDADAPPFTPASLVRYQLGNHLGSASLELDGAGEIISYEEYFPYGSTSYRAVRSGVEVSPKRYRYTGKERDEETGFYYHGARYYAPWLGRWTSCDPAGMVDGVNIYVYVTDNPIKKVDATGRWGEEGHFWTVYVLAMAAGFDERIAHRMAFYAYMPDRVRELDATSVQIEYLRLFINHALSGRGHLPERSFREGVVRSLAPGSVEHGLALHAYGDAFSHRNLDNPSTQYQREFGHYEHGGRPDNIDTNPVAYREYVTQLFGVLSDQATLARGLGMPITTTGISTNDVQALLGPLTSMQSYQDRIAFFRNILTTRFHVSAIQGPGHTTNPSQRRVASYTVPDNFDTFRSLNPGLMNNVNLNRVYAFYDLMNNTFGLRYPVWGQADAPRSSSGTHRPQSHRHHVHHQQGRTRLIDTNRVQPQRNYL
jgi:RHS repeat-associated protein